MPFIRTAIAQHTSAEDQAAIVQGVHQALIEAIGMPKDELFNLVTRYAPGDFAFDCQFNGARRGDSPVVVEITMRRGRSDTMKKALYAAIAQKLHEQARVAPDDVFIFVHENDYSDWSVAGGRFAMALVQQRLGD